MPRTTYAYLRQAQLSLQSISGGGITYVVQSPNGTLYAIVSTSYSDIDYMTSTDDGLTWSPPVSVFAGTVTAVAVWFDRWTPGLTTGLIHLVFTDAGTDNTFYRTIDTESSDALSTRTVVFDGATTDTGGHLAVTRARGGNVYCKTVIDAGAEGGFFRLPNANVPDGAWDAARTINETLATDDQVILMPGFAADNQDIILLHWDASEDEVSRQLYDDSENTWSETSIAGSMTDILRTVSGPHFDACCMTGNSEIYLAAWSNVDAANATLRFWTITDSAITEGTAVVQASADDQGLSAIGYDSLTGEIYVFYCGNSAGTETWFTAVNIYYKVSADGGATWGSEQTLTPSARSIVSIWCCPRTVGGPPSVICLDNSSSTQPNYNCVATVVTPGNADVIIRDSQPLLGSINGGGRNFVIEAPNGTLYAITTDDFLDVSYKTSTDYGLTWSPLVSVFAGSATAVAVWFDRWTPGLTTGLIHVVYTESATDDTLYRTIDTAASDALSTQTVVFAGATTVNPGGGLAVTRARGGNVYCRTTIDAGAEGGFFRLPNANVPSGAWDAARTVDETLATDDQWILVPGFAADNQDIMMIFSDSSASELSRKIYDDSANSWSESSIATAMTTGSFATAGPHFAACCQVSLSQIFVAAWSDSDTVGADLRFWTVTEGAITEGTNVVLDSSDDQGLCAIGYNALTAEIYVFYCGKSDGSETAWTALNIYYKVSSDGGATWGTETQLTSRAYGITSLICCPRAVSGPPLVMFIDSSNSAQPQYRCVARILDPATPDFMHGELSILPHLFGSIWMNP